MCIHYASWPNFEFMPSEVASVLMVNNGPCNCHSVLPSADDEIFVLDVVSSIRRLSQLVLGEDLHNANVVLCPNGFHLGKVCDHMLL